MKKSKKKTVVVALSSLAAIIIILAGVSINALIGENGLIGRAKLAKEQYTNATIDEQEKLNETKKNINSNEYIEQIAREKLGMYLPNERVYIDIGK